MVIALTQSAFLMPGWHLPSIRFAKRNLIQFGCSKVIFLPSKTRSLAFVAISMIIIFIIPWTPSLRHEIALMSNFVFT